VIKKCYGCERFQAIALKSPPTGNLSRERTEGKTEFQVIGVDFASPLKYRKGKKNEGKVYIVLYSCDLTRGIYLELLPNMKTTEFITSLKRFIAHWRCPEKIYSDNGKTFVGTANLLKTIMSDEKVGGQFERLIGLTFTSPSVVAYCRNGQSCRTFY